MGQLASALLSFLLLAVGASAAPSRKLLSNGTAPARKLYTIPHVILVGGGNNDLFVRCDKDTKHCTGVSKSSDATTFSAYVTPGLYGQKQLRLPNPDGLTDSNLCLALQTSSGPLQNHLVLKTCSGIICLASTGVVSDVDWNEWFMEVTALFGGTSISASGRQGLWWNGVGNDLTFPPVACNADLAWQCKWKFQTK